MAGIHRNREHGPGILAAAWVLAAMSCASPGSERPLDADVDGGDEGGAGADGPEAGRASEEGGAGGAASGGAAGSPGAGGDSGTGTGGGSGAGGSPAAGVPTFVIVGYGGLRVRSIDGGRTWVDAQRLGGGGDDEYLLRTVAYGNGLFVAAGWQIHTSRDGKTWTRRTNPENQWLGGVRFGSGRFVGAGGYGYSAYSLDGISWMTGGGRGTDAARSVAYGDGVWMARADSGSWWRTTDGRSWTSVGGGHQGGVVYCDGEFRDAARCSLPIARNDGRTAFGDGVYISVSNRQVQRSTDGRTWSNVYTASDGLEDVAFGYAAE